MRPPGTSGRLGGVRWCVLVIVIVWVACAGVSRHQWSSPRPVRPCWNRHHAAVHVTRDTAGVAHYIMDCLEVLGALDDASDDAPTSSLSAPAAG